MAKIPLSKKDILQAAVLYLEHLKKNEKGQVVLSEFPEGLFPPGITPYIRSFLFGISETNSLAELLEKKGAIVEILNQINQELPPTAPVVLPKTEVIIYPPEEKKKKRATRIKGVPEIEEILEELTKQIERIRGKRKEEKVVFEEKPLTATEKEVRETILAIQEKAQGELKKTINKLSYAKRIKAPAEEIARRIGQAVKDNLETLTEVNDAVRWAQAEMQKAGLHQEDAYKIAKKIIGEEVKRVAVRYQTSLFNKHNEAHQTFTKLVRDTLNQSGLPPEKISLVISAIDEGVDPILTKGLSQQDPDSAKKIIKTTVLKVLANTISPESAEFIASALASQAPIIQNLARVSDRWDVPEKVKNIAFERTAPPETKKLAVKIKEFIIGYGLGGVYLRREEPKIEEVAKAAAEKIVRRIRARTLSTKNLPEVVKKALFDSLDEQKHGSVFVKKVKENIEKTKGEEFPQSLLQVARENIPPQLFPWEKKELKKLKEQGILSEESAEEYQKELTKPPRIPDPWLVPAISQPAPGIIAKAACAYLVSNEQIREKEEKDELSEKQKFLLEQAKNIVPKNRIARNLLSRVFKIFTKGRTETETPFRTLETISQSGPPKINLPSKFKREIFNRFINAFLKKIDWLDLESPTGKLYFRFGRHSLRKGFSRLLTPLKRKITLKAGRLFKTASQVLTKIGKFLKQFSPFIKKLGLAALKALGGLLATALNALLGIVSAAAGFLSSALAAIAGATAGPVLVVLAIALLIILIVVLFFLNVQLPSTFVDFSKERPVGTCKLTDSFMLSQSLALLFKDAGEAFNVPPAVIAGVAAIEGRYMWGYNDTEISAFSLPGAQDPYNCQPNICGARGPMQFLTGEEVDEEKCPQAVGIDIWSHYKNAVNEATGENRNPHVCNIKDSIFAAAKKLKKDSRTSQGNDCEWSKEEVYNAARGYYGKCEYKIKNGPIIISGNYCERVWQYYINHS